MASLLSHTKQVAAMIVEAVNSNRQIAAKLGLAEDTIKGYLKIIYSKLGAADRTHAVTIAARRGVIDL